MRRENLIGNLMLKYSGLWTLAMIFSYVLSRLVVEGAELISNAINTMTQGENIDVVHLLYQTGIIIFFSMLVTFLKSISGELFSIKIQRECKNVTIEALEKTQYRFFEKNAGSVINKLTSDISDMGKLLSEILPDILQYFVMMVTISAAIVKMNWIIFIGIAIVFPAAVFSSHVIAKKINDLAKKRRGKYDELADIALDNIEGIEVAKAYGIEKILGKRVIIKADEILKNEYARNRYQALANGLTSLIKWIPTMICSLIALFLVLNQTITVGELMAFLVLFGKISTPLSELPFRIIDAREMIISVKRINDLMDTPKETSGSFQVDDIGSVTEMIKMDKITFAYNADQGILKNVDLTINRGEVVAIVGASGAGKSTLMKILCGFETPVSGKYNLCGHEFADWNIEAARQLISYVPQDSYLFPGTVAENVAYGCKKINIEQVENVCKNAGIYETINNLPDQFNTEVGERGVKLSGGERQRISIARALYKNAPIILLDEPTSALDEQTEKVIRETIFKNPEKTAIVIAHRLSTIKNADRIYCMDRGQIAEAGTHEELMKMNGVYAALYGREVLV